MIYPNLFVYLNGRLLAENVSVDTRIEKRDSEEVFSLVRGFEGVNLGPLVRVTEAESLTPRAGDDVDYEQLFLEHQRVELMLVEGGSGRLTVANGWLFGEVSRSGGVRRLYTVSFKHVGGAIPFA